MPPFSSPSPPQSPSSRLPEPGERDLPTVWLVDDSPLQRELTRRILERHHRVVMFDRAAPMLERLSAGERPDVLVLDWYMPDVSGLEACQFSRSVADAVELPIIVMTAIGDQSDLLDGLAAGANDFVRKPVSSAEINARVRGLITTKRLHARVAAAESALREEATFRERFLAILAHDLRQPLNTFALGSEALAASDTPQTARVKVKSLFDKANGRMQRMIADLLDFSRSRPQGGGIPILPQPVDAAAVVGSIVEEIRLEHSQRTINLETVATATGTWDGDRLAQVVSNLLENALAHGARDAAVDVSLTASAEEVELTVENDGKPLPQAMVAALFDPFRRGASPTKDGGLGLGLYIVDRIVAGHGGNIAVTCAGGRVRFSVRLPRTPTLKRAL